MTEGQTSNPPSLKRLLAVTLIAGVAATVLTVLVVLPAEFGKDPTGFGHLTGLSELAPETEEVIEVAAGPAAPAQFRETAYRTHTVEIPLAAKDDDGGGHQLEYKVRMKTGDAIVYAWTADAPHGELYYDLHAETAPNPKVQVLEFKQATGSQSNGSLVAPVDALHGWYFRNDSGDPVVVRLQIAGFYELVAPGENGNKAGILPK